MKLKRLKIERFRGVEPGTEILFGEGFNVLLGQNGTGKTTLLRLISSVFVGDFRWLAGESFVVEYELLAEGFALEIKISNSEPVGGAGFAHLNQKMSGILGGAIPRVPLLECNIRVDDKKIATFRLRPREQSMKLLENPEQMAPTELDPLNSSVALHLILHILWMSVSRIVKFIPPQETMLTQQEFLSVVDGTIHAWRLDESLELFLGLTGRMSALGVHEYDDSLGKLFIGYTDADGALPGGKLIPPELRALGAKNDIDSASHPPRLTLAATDDNFLASVIKLLGLSEAVAQLDFIRKDVADTGNSIEYGNLRFFFTRRDGSIIDQDHLSYGQKRLLTFYYYLACNPHVVIADELVNGLHHSWIAECMKAMGDRQVFLTSQNPILLDHLPFDSADAVRRTFVTCLAIPEGPKDRLLWGNMSKKDAASFYRAYKVGIQHVGEILRTKGLW